MSVFDEKYWTNRYESGQTQWDAGGITRPLKEYIDQLGDKSLKILIPGAGNGYEAAYLYEQGFRQVYMLDLSPLPLEEFARRNPLFPRDQLLLGDFFEQQGNYDLILEQTFFCALHPRQRPAYAKKAYELLKAGGKLAGLLFDAPLNKDHPPFGGNREEYLRYFGPYFDVLKLEPCYNSIKPRAGSELWLALQKPHV